MSETIVPSASVPTAPESGPPAALPPQPSAPAEKLFTQDDLDRRIAHLVAKERAAADQRVQAERDAIEKDKLRAQQEWQKLAEQHETRVKELQPQLDALTKGIEARDAELLKTVKAETKDWPPEAKALIPAEGDALAQMAAVSSARALVAKLGEPGPRTPGNTPGPRPAGEPNKSLVDREMDRLRATGTYGNRQPAPHP
jgi:hypothetical protein